MPKAYDPLNVPDPDDWLSIDEHERIGLVTAYHKDAGMELPNEQVHAVVHVVVENQIAMGDETAAQATLERLVHEGLDRHEAIHAIGSVLVEFMQEVLGDDAPQEVNERYDEELKKLTAAEWLKTFE